MCVSVCVCVCICISDLSPIPCVQTPKNKKHTLHTCIYIAVHVQCTWAQCECINYVGICIIPLVPILQYTCDSVIQSHVVENEGLPCHFTYIHVL